MLNSDPDKTPIPTLIEISPSERIRSFSDASTSSLLSIDTTNHDKLERLSLLSPYRQTSNLPSTPRTPLSELSTITEASPAGRTLTWWSAYILIISRVIGSGIFATPGVIAQSAGSIGLSILLWLLGAVIAACSLAVSLELGCMLPRSGGELVYPEFIYKKPRFLASTLVAAQALLLGFSASNSVVFGKYILFALDIPSTDILPRIIAAGLIIGITVIHARHLETGIWLQNVLGWTKLLVLAAVTIFGFVTIFTQSTGLLTTQFNTSDNRLRSATSFSWSSLFTGSDFSISTLATCTFQISHAYSGYDNINNVLDEVQDPVRTLKSAAPAAMLTTCLFYLVLNIAYFAVVPLAEVKQSGELIGALFFERVTGGRWAGIFPLLIALSAAGNVMVTTFAQARVNQAVGRRGILPGPFSRFLTNSKPYGTPAGGLAVHLAISLLVISLPAGSAGSLYGFILNSKGFPASMTGAAIGLGLLILRKTRSDLRRPYKAWTLTVIAPLVLNGALIVAPFVSSASGKARRSNSYALPGLGAIGFAICFWVVKFWMLPRWEGFTYEEVLETGEDGTTAAQLIRVKRDFNVESSARDNRTVADGVFVGEKVADEERDSFWPHV